MDNDYLDSEEEFDFDIQFDDVTMCETQGVFDDVERLMLEDFPAPKVWAIKTLMTIDSRFGLARIVLFLYWDRKIRIVEFAPSIGDVYYSPDVQVLTVWAQENGWEIPEVEAGLAKSAIEFWKHYWDTSLVDCPYLEEVFGERGKVDWKGSNG
jgi:hypothetical protein